LEVFNGSLSCFALINIAGFTLAIMAIFMGVRHMLVPDTALCTAGSGANLEKMPTQQFTCLINYLLHRPTEKGKLYRRYRTEPEQGNLRKKEATPLTSLGQEKRRANFTEKKTN